MADYFPAKAKVLWLNQWDNIGKHIDPPNMYLLHLTILQVNHLGVGLLRLYSRHHAQNPQVASYNNRLDHRLLRRLFLSQPLAVTAVPCRGSA